MSRNRLYSLSWSLGRRLVSLLMVGMTFLELRGEVGEEAFAVVYHARRNGILGWDALNPGPEGRPLGAITNGNWTINFGLTALPKSERHLVYSRRSGLGIWDIFTNTEVGELANGEGGNWTVTDISFDPTDDTRLVYGAANGAGLAVWELTTRRTIGSYRSVTNGNWRDRGFEVVPGHPEWIVYGTSNGLKVWDADKNQELGPFKNLTFANWNSGLVFAPMRGVEPSRVFPIASHPESQTVTVGGSVTFRVRVEGAGPVTNSWLINGKYLPGKSLLPLDPTGVTELTLPDVRKDQEGTVQWEVLNPYAKIRGAPAALVVNEFPAIAFRAYEMQWRTLNDRQYRVEGTPVLGTSLVLPAGTPMMLQPSPSSPWQVVADPSAWVRGTGEEMRVLFSIRDDPTGFYHVANSAAAVPR